MGLEFCVADDVPRTLTPVTGARIGYANCKMSRADSLMDSMSKSYKDSVRQALRQHHFSYVITDPRLADHPIVYASDGFLEMTGYVAEEVLGRNCRFLQGPNTDRRTVLEIRDAIREERACQVAILNYTKQGRAFWNLFHMAPIYSKEEGRVIHFVGVQTPVSECIAAGFSSRMDSSPFTVVNPRCGCPSKSCCLGSSAENRAMNLFTPDPEVKFCENLEVNKQKSISAVRSLLCELAASSKCRATEERCSIVAACSAGESVVCSSLMLSLTKIQQSFVLCNPHLPDMPIIHASDMFLRLTGYTLDEVVGRNCRFLQGPNTDPTAVEQISESIKLQQACTVRILNYRKDKTPFWNLLHITSVRNAEGKVAFYVGVQLDVTPVDEDEHQDFGMTPRMKQLGAVGAIRVAVRSLQGPGLRRVQKNS
uniref:Putative LOV domain-containing protein n=1 Tax=Sceptridium dissectum TaxID=93613 RepID=A0A126WWR2_SCEDI|nr:putative LOV domain-containing protein [Sceptridium dissectum]